MLKSELRNTHTPKTRRRMIAWNLFITLMFCSRVILFGRSFQFMQMNPLRQISSRLSRRSGLLQNNRVELFSTTDSTKQLYDYSHLPSETLFIIDGTAMLYHAYHSRNSKDRFQNAVFSDEYSTKLFSKLSVELQKEVNGLLIKDSSAESSADKASKVKLSSSAISAMLYHFAYFVKTVKPAYIAIAFDYGKDTFRSKLLPSYKTHRPKVISFELHLFITI